MLSIVYITCNRCAELEKSILSCEEHVSMEHEYIVIDNGSVDDTEQVIQTLIELKINIRYLRQETNLGVSGGRNEGFEQARGDILYFIDDDATIISTGLCLDAAYQFMYENEVIYAMGTDCYDTERKCQLVGQPERGHAINTECKIKNYVGCSHFIRKAAVKREKLYPANLIYGAEELYAGLGFYRDDGCVYQYPKLKILHQPSSNTRTSRTERQRNGHINTYVIKKYFLPGYYRWLSFVVFSMRIVRFEKLNVKKIVKDFKLAYERYDSQYRLCMNYKQVRKCMTMFRALKIL